MPATATPRPRIPVGTTGFIGAFNAALSVLLGFDGTLTPIVTGLGKPAGEVFLAAPEASTWTMMVLGFEGIVLVGCRRKRSLALRRA
jgi:hypothetical protein